MGGRGVGPARREDRADWDYAGDEQRRPAGSIGGHSSSHGGGFISARVLGFTLRLLAWSLALFGVMRLPWFAAHILLPLTYVQAAAASTLLGPSSVPVEVTLACSGADAVALCLATIVAYPTRWRARLAGGLMGVAGILALNTVRIGTLGHAAASPRWFNALHLYIWPAVLTLAIAGFVLTWMLVVEGRRPADAAPVHTPSEPDWRVTGWFALVAAVFLGGFTLASPLYLESDRVLALADLIARAAASLLSLLGMQATATARVLTTPRGAFLVTPECIATPLIPVYFAAVLFYAPNWWTRALWAAAAAPLFMALGIARLLVVVVPAGLDTPPAFFIHAFSQLLVAAGMVCGLALWRYGARATTLTRAVLALSVAVAFVRVLGAPYTHLILWFGTGAALDDPQGAMMFLPAFQIGLFLALWTAAFVRTGWTRFFCGASLLAALQVAAFGGVGFLIVHAGVAPLVRDVRAWALLGPALAIALVVNVASRQR